MHNHEIIPVAHTPPNPDPAREKLEHETTMAVCASVQLTGSARADQRAITRTYTLCRKNIAEYEDSTLHKIREAANTGLRHELLRMVTYDNRTEDYVNDWIALEPYREQHSFPRIQGVLLALDQYPDLAPRSSEDERYEQLKAIIRITMHFNFDTKKVTVVRSGAFKSTRLFIADEGIRSLLTNHEHPGVVADIIIERNLIDYEQIAAVINNMKASEPALVSGVL